MLVKNFCITDFRERKLPDERAVMASWLGSRIEVSIVCTTYNHEAYLEEAIRGFITQRTNFPFEIVIHDDVSTDATREIINNYAGKYPTIIRAVFQKENQYSKGEKVLLLGVAYATGQYIAICEGDDFWIADNKLQTQIDAIRAFPDCEICFHSAVMLSGDIPVKKLFCRRAKEQRLFQVGPIIRCGGSFMPTASMLIRMSFFDRVFQDKSSFYKTYLMGYFYQTFCSLSGGALYIDEPMSAYRSFSEGSWTQTISNNPVFYEKWRDRYLASIREADIKTNYKYSKDFRVPLRRYHLSVLNNPAIDLPSRKSYFAKNSREIGWVGKVLWFSLIRWSILHKFALLLRTTIRSI
ncbi:MAG: glycosyltransferase [Candidatus Polarisedimenticolaceae bacterium]|nr:glycosyltransferase [Candidatus Polarisedimenticolaceae bacterium]